MGEGYFLFEGREDGSESLEKLEFKENIDEISRFSVGMIIGICFRDENIVYLF